MNLYPKNIKANVSSELPDRERHNMLDRLVDNIDGLIYCCLYDEFWTMVFVSAGCKKLTGYEQNSLMFNRLTSYEEITLQEDRSYVRKLIKDSLKLGNRFEIEYRIRHADGSIIWVSEKGNPVFDANNNIISLEGIIQNINTQKNLELSLQDAEMRYRSIFENAVEGIFQTSLDGQYIIANPALAQMYGYDNPEELINALNNIEQQLYVNKQRREEFIIALEKDEKIINFESSVYKKNGDTIWISENARKVYDTAGNLRCYEGTVEDITLRKNHDSELEYKATHDSLTGLPNRYILNDRLQQCINHANRYKNKLAIAFIDLDNFKFINDTMGHEVGDKLLLLMSQRLSSAIREVDTLVRLGGDEFILLIANINDISEIAVSMKRLLNTVAEPCQINDLDYLVTSSIGVSIYPDDGDDSVKLLKHADSAMYQAKKSGRNNFHLYTPELNSLLLERVETEYKLRLAIENNEFLLHYQPKVDFITGLITSVEALIRWKPLGKKLIPPAKFIHIAEETGLIDKLGEWVLRNACIKAKHLESKMGHLIPVAVNVSPRQFRNANFTNIVNKILIETQLNPDTLILEITENTVTDDVSKFIQTLCSLKQLGVKLAIDDFGTGYSSLAYLKDFPVDELKIDKVFVSNLEIDPANKAILKTIITLGKSLGKKVVAEGVETLYQYEYLKSIGCDELQGYFFSKPLPENEFDDFYLKNCQCKTF